MLKKISTIKKMYDFALQSEQNENFKEAIFSYNEILKAEPNHLNSIVNLGKILSKLKKFDLSKNLFKEAIKINPNHSDIYFHLGKTYKILGELLKAKSSFEKAIKINPNVKNAHSELGELLFNSGENIKAKACYEKAIKIDPNKSYLYNNLGMVNFSMKYLKESLSYFEKAIKMNPNNENYFNNIGMVYKMSGDLKKAKSSYEQSIKINPNYTNAHCNLGEVFEKIGENKKSIKSFQRAIELDPNFTAALNNLAVVLNRIGEYKKAIYNCEKTLKINPNFLPALQTLGTIYLKKDEKQKALSCYERAIKINPYSINNQRYWLDLLYTTKKQSIFQDGLNYLLNLGVVNAVIGSYISRSEARYQIRKPNPFCKYPINYVLKTNLTEVCNFKDIYINGMENILKKKDISTRETILIKNGSQTDGNLFSQNNNYLDTIKYNINLEIEKYRSHFKDSNEGFLKNWPSDWYLYGWFVRLNSGGSLSAHMHERGWLSGSIYLNVPPKIKTDSGNLVVRINKEEEKLNENLNLKKTINVVTGSLCLFPSSLLHYTIPFTSKEERLVLAFDVVPRGK